MMEIKITCCQVVEINKDIGIEELMENGNFEVTIMGNDDIQVRCRACQKVIIFKER